MRMTANPRQRSNRMETKTADKGFQTDPQGCFSGRAITVP
jgi:hypothetical protein